MPVPPHVNFFKEKRFLQIIFWAFQGPISFLSFTVLLFSSLSWCVKDMLNVLSKSHFYLFILWRSSSTWENKYSIWLRTLETRLDHVLLSPSIFLCVRFSTEPLSNRSSSADIAEGRRHLWKINVGIKSSLSCVHIAALERNAIGVITKGFTFTSSASLRYFSNLNMCDFI